VWPVIDTNITGTLILLHKVGRDMRSRSEGRILIVGSIAGIRTIACGRVRVECTMSDDPALLSRRIALNRVK